VHVVIVDDDVVNRLGMGVLLVAFGQVQLIASINHEDALARLDFWNDVDVVVVDAADHRREFDQFPGVTVVQHIRRHAGDRPAIIVVTGHYFDDAVRRRMHEARADSFYHRADMAAEGALISAVLCPEARRGIPGPFNSETQFRLGVTEYSCVNDAVDYAIRNELEQRLAKRVEPRSRRWLRLRAEFNQIARLTPIKSDGRRPDRTQQEPSLPQIARFIEWATKVKIPSPGASYPSL
jgi:CheY-like chemotaxis protein